MFVRNKVKSKFIVKKHIVIVINIKHCSKPTKFWNSKTLIKSIMK